MRRHRLAERLLLDVIGLDWPLVHQEACRWEHVMSTDVELKLMDLLGGPTRSPYGNPIPGLGALGGHEVSVESFRNGVQPLSAHESGGTFVVRRLEDHRNRHNRQGRAGLPGTSGAHLRGTRLNRPRVTLCDLGGTSRNARHARQDDMIRCDLRHVKWWIRAQKRCVGGLSDARA